MDHRFQIGLLRQIKQYIVADGRWREEYLDALDGAEDCIKKQIPCKPTTYDPNNHQEVRIAARCPSCKYRLHVGNAGKKPDKYCSNCGQLIDWTEVKLW